MRSLLLLSLLVTFVASCDRPTSSSTEASANSTSATPTASSAKPPAPKKVEKPKIDESVNMEGLMSAKLPPEQLDFGWIRLFDGQSLMGWKPSSQANWKIDDGSISVDSGDQGFLFTTSRFGDFELKLEYLTSAKSNSGVFLRSPLNPTNPAEDCYEFNIAPTDNPFPTGSLVGRQKAEPDAIGPLDEQDWHTLHALLKDRE